MKYIFTIIVIFFISANIIAQSSDNVYIFSYFKNNGADGLHLAYSNDGYTWTSLNNDSTYLHPTVSKDKLMRDPCIIRGGDGNFQMVWTVSWNDRGIGHASSPDLIHWSEQQYIPVMQHEDSARNCWAPEIFYDKTKKEYLIYWATTIPGRFPGDSAGDSKYNHRIYYTITKDFKTFSPTALLYNQGFNTIDATIQQDGKQFVMFVKDETRYPPQKNIRIAISKKLTKGYNKPSAPITGNYWAEGPTVIKIGNNWIVYFDKYRDRQYGAVTSTDLIHWTDISDKVHFPAGVRHGTVFKISNEEFLKLK
ncbi:MAG: glycoside hydrolase family 43 protein [Chitinophagaceae bacterium]